MIGEIDDVMKLITDALGMSASYDASLTARARNSRPRENRDQVKAIVESLVKSTREMRDTNKALEERLSLSKSEISNLQHSLEAIRAESLTDPLTGLGNRKYFDRSIDMAVQAALASGEPLSLLMFDIDHFKSFNDSYGHLTGDQVLRLVGMSLKQTIKGQDITARYGGEEFAVVLPNTALRQALTVADHIRRAVMAKELKKKSTGEILGRVTISVGVSMLKPGDDTDVADRTRRRLPLRRQAQRPQPRDLRSRSRIRRRDPEPGGLEPFASLQRDSCLRPRRLRQPSLACGLAFVATAFRRLARLRPLRQRRALRRCQRRPRPCAKLLRIVEQPRRQLPVRIHRHGLGPGLVLKRL